ncbi:ABC transporter permease [Corynebacterium spheniscorum]|uniref:ABC-2 type transport system permease protein n=1 Tax=Corynebacterium spheniscorum TaxID=185761 RepID=A0A1I2RSK5_9CORY|nr:ABC transporter permease [Corynebacterium spheniscorum]KAA8724044.1 ABC transporter permease [Corynebacterium spheniscorum]SFG42509.1 ABC-2 type transport system permease protein [Corynebacterium spheniscorum]
MHDVLLIARREFKVSFFKKATLISIAVTFLLIIGGMFFISWLSKNADDTSTVHLGVAPEAMVLQDELHDTATQLGAELNLVELNESTAVEQLKTEDIDAYIQSLNPATVLTEHQLSATEQSLISTAAQNYSFNTLLSSLGADPAQAKETLTGAQLEVRTLETEDAATTARTFTVTPMITLVFFTIIVAGSMLAMSVVEEKSSRVVEVLLSTIRPVQLLAGKIIGITSLAFLQLLLYGAAFSLGPRILGQPNLLEGFDIPLGLHVLVWGLLALILNSVLWAALASLVSRQEDIGAISMPMTFIPMAGFYLAIFLVQNQSELTPLVTVLALIPLFTPFVMPMLLAKNLAPLWLIGAGYLVLILSILAVLFLGARIYRRAVLHSGGRMKLREALS